MKIESQVIKYQDNIDTDVIIAGKYTKTLIMQDLADHAFEDLDLNFGKKIKNAKFIAAGKNFGCGSSREQAPLALKYAGVKCIIAKSFARIFYRNAINIGIVLVETDTDCISDGDILSYQIGSSILENLTKNKQMKVKDLPIIMVNILREGGLVNYLKKYKTYNI